MVNMKGVAFLRVAVALLCGAGGLMAHLRTSHDLLGSFVGQSVSDGDSA